jgi:hypothetical protein
MSADAQARTATVGDITLLVCTQFSSPCILLRQAPGAKRIFLGDETLFRIDANFSQRGFQDG